MVDAKSESYEESSVEKSVSKEGIDLETDQINLERMEKEFYFELKRVGQIIQPTPYCMILTVQYARTAYTAASSPGASSAGASEAASASTAAFAASMPSAIFAAAAPSIAAIAPSKAGAPPIGSPPAVGSG